MRGPQIKDQEQSRLRRFRIAAVVWGVFIFAVNSWPQPPEVPVLSSLPQADKASHVFLYAVEAFLIYRAVAWRGRPRLGRRALAVVGVMALWAAVDEIHQEWIPGRGAEASDFAADLGGGGAGALLASAVARAGAGRARSEG